jgi:hypothetical protein
MKRDYTPRREHEVQDNPLSQLGGIRHNPLSQFRMSNVAPLENNPILPGGSITERTASRSPFEFPSGNLNIPPTPRFISNAEHLKRISPASNQNGDPFTGTLAGAVQGVVQTGRAFAAFTPTVLAALGGTTIGLMQGKSQSDIVQDIHKAAADINSALVEKEIPNIPTVLPIPLPVPIPGFDGGLINNLLHKQDEYTQAARQQFEGGVEKVMSVLPGQYLEKGLTELGLPLAGFWAGTITDLAIFSLIGVGRAKVKKTAGLMSEFLREYSPEPNMTLGSLLKDAKKIYGEKGEGIRLREVLSAIFTKPEIDNLRGVPMEIIIQDKMREIESGLTLPLKEPIKVPPMDAVEIARRADKLELKSLTDKFASRTLYSELKNIEPGKTIPSIDKRVKVPDIPFDPTKRRDALFNKFIKVDEAPKKPVYKKYEDYVAPEVAPDKATTLIETKPSTINIEPKEQLRKKEQTNKPKVPVEDKKVVIEPVEGKDYIQVNVDPKYFDSAFKKQKFQYIDSKGNNSVPEKMAKATDYVMSEEAIDIPKVHINTYGEVVFEDGRHRYTAMRDTGAKSIPVAMTPDGKANAQKLGLVKEDSISKPVEEKTTTFEPLSSTVNGSRVRLSYTAADAPAREQILNVLDILKQSHEGVKASKSGKGTDKRIDFVFDLLDKDGEPLTVEATTSALEVLKKALEDNRIQNTISEKKGERIRKEVKTRAAEAKAVDATSKQKAEAKFKFDVERNAAANSTPSREITSLMDDYYEMALDEGIIETVKRYASGGAKMSEITGAVKRNIEEIYKGTSPEEMPFFENADFIKMVVSVAVKDGIKIKDINKEIIKWNAEETPRALIQAKDNLLDVHRELIEDTARSLAYVPGISEFFEAVKQFKISKVKPSVIDAVTFSALLDTIESTGLSPHDVFDRLGIDASTRRAFYTEFNRGIAAFVDSSLKEPPELTKKAISKTDELGNSVNVLQDQSVTSADFRKDWKAAEMIKYLEDARYLVNDYTKGSLVAPERSKVNNIIAEAPIEFVEKMGKRFGKFGAVIDLTDVSSIWSPHKGPMSAAFTEISGPVIDYMFAEHVYRRNMQQTNLWVRDIKKTVGTASNAIEKAFEPMYRKVGDILKTVESIDKQIAASKKTISKMAGGKQTKPKYKIERENEIAVLEDRRASYKFAAQLEFDAVYDKHISTLAKEHAGVRIALKVADKLPAGIQLSDVELNIAKQVREYYNAARMDLLKVDLPVKDTFYATHVIRNAFDFVGSQSFIDTIVGKKEKSFLLKAQEQLSDRVTFPDIATMLEVYNPMIEKKLAYTPVRQKFMRPEVLEKLSDKAIDYWNKFEEKNFAQGPLKAWEKALNVVTNYEYLRVVGGSLAVAFRHLTKVSGTLSQHSPVVVAKAHALLGKAVVQAGLKTLGIKGKYNELQLVKSFMNVTDIVRAFDEAPISGRTVIAAIKTVASSPLVLIEAYDNGLNILSGLLSGSKKGMGFNATHRAIQHSVLQVNFRGGIDQMLWRKSALSRTSTMLQQTLFKLAEQKHDMIIGMLQGKRDVFGTHYGYRLGRFLIYIGLAEIMARANDTSLLDITLFHLPFVNHLIKATESAPYYKLSPGLELSQNPMLQHITEAGKYGIPKTEMAEMVQNTVGPGVLVAATNMLTDFGQIRKLNKAIVDQEFNSKYYDSNIKYLLGLSKVEED